MGEKRGLGNHVGGNNGDLKGLLFRMGIKPVSLIKFDVKYDNPMTGARMTGACQRA